VKLHKVTLTHYSQKDSATATVSWLLADDEEQVIAWLCASRGVYVPWEDWAADEDEGEVSPSDEWWAANPDAKDRAVALGLTLPVEKYDGVTGPKTALLRWWRGDFDEPTDLYYGATDYAWDAGVEVTPEDAAVLLRLGVAADARALATP
jgi:hypothetical protein